MWQVRKLTDKNEILRFLERDRRYAAYAIGDLEEPFWEQCRWFGAESGGQLRALVLLFTGLDPHALFLMGETAGLAVVLGSALRPRRPYITCREKHLPAVRAFYDLTPPEPMVRMVLRPEIFRPVETRSVSSHVRALRLGPAWTGQLERLYALGQGNAFSPYQVALGVFYGVAYRGQLLAAAGTHLVSPTYRVAAVGNVFTHPEHRRQGYATVCTSRVVEELLGRGIDTIVLNVRQDNHPAIRIYERLGFYAYCPILEMLGARR